MGQNYSTRPVSAAVLRCFVVLRCDLVTVVFGVCGFRLCLCCGCVFCRLLLLFVVVCCCLLFFLLSLLVFAIFTTKCHYCAKH